MKNRLWLVILAAMLMTGAEIARADDIDCPEDKVKTCFVDGGSATSCICLDAPENRDETPPVGPAEEESADEYTGGADGMGGGGE